MLIRIFICSLFFLCCGNKGSTKISPVLSKESAEVNFDTSYNTLDPFHPQYDFSFPSSTHVLARELREVSGLCFEAETNKYFAINDENGLYFLLNPGNFKIESKREFARPGDYEAIEKVGEHIYVLKSNGNIYVYNSKTRKLEVLRSELSSKNNAEGLCYDADEHALLIACKGQPLEGETKEKNVKAIYKYDLDDSTLDSSPFLEILDTELVEYVEVNYSLLPKSKLKKHLSRVQTFAPSGIAIQPETKDYYIISAKGSMLAIDNKNKKLRHVAFLNDKTITQPEGITFDTDKALIIATEGKSFNGKIFKWNLL